MAPDEVDREAPGDTGRLRRPGRRPPGPGARRAGYLWAIVISAVLLWCAHHLLAWGVPVVTPDLDRVLPYYDLTVGATIAVNVVWLFHDPRWLRSLGGLVTDVLGLRLLRRAWQVFPFAFRTHARAGELTIRTLLVVAFVGLVLATVAEVVRLVRLALGLGSREAAR